MKHLKKLSVVLMMTSLFSLTFTSCIDNEVSDAVDQVYLAQAEFLQAQAALKEAEAQKALAEAAHENARAEYQLSLAALQDAYTAGILITNAGMVETNAYNASRNVQLLADAQARLEVVLQTQLVLLAEQERLYDIAMVNLAEAVAQAKDVLIVGYYGDYAFVTNMLQDLYEDRIQAEHDLALKELMLTAINSPVELVSWAYYQSLLEGDLADLEGQLDAKEAKLATLEAITPANASDTQKAITALEGQIAVLQEQFDALVIDHAETLNAQDQAYEAWQAETAKYNTLMNAENLYKAAVAAKKVHTDMIAATQTAIGLATNNLTIGMASVDTTTAYNAVVAAKLDLTTKQGLVGVNYTNDSPDNIKDPKITDAPKVVAKAWDNVWNAELAAIKKDATYDSISKYLAPSISLGSPYVYLNELELNLATAINAVSGTLPPSIAAAQVIYDAALLRETAAQAAYNTNPGGSTWTDGLDASPTYPNTFVGDHTDGVLVTTSFKRVATWQELPVTGSGIWYPLTYTAAATIPAIPVVLGFDEFDATTGINTVNKDATLGATPTLAYFVEVELDDSPTVNVTEMHLARYFAQIAEDNLLILQGNLTGEVQDIADAQLLLNLGYTALGYTIPPVGNPLTSDWNAALALQAAALTAKNNAIAAIGYATNSFGTTITLPYSGAEMATAYYQVVLAEAAVQTAINALGTDFRPAADTNPFTTMYGQWWTATGTPTLVSTYTVFGPNLGIYQQLQGLVSATVTGRIYTLPHVGATLTAYQKLRNAYFQMAWAKESFDATRQVTYYSYLLGSNYTDTNAKVIAQATKDIAALNALLPSHDYAIAYLLGEFTALAAEFNFDMTLWDLEGGHGLGQLLYNLPLYAAYLDAVKDTNAVIAEFSSVGTQIEDLENLIEAYAFLQNAYAFGGDSQNVADFMDTVGADITNTKLDIDVLMEDIEIQKGLVATGIVDKAKAQAWVAEYERRLEVIETKITGFESAAANLLARITALLG